MGAFDKVSNTDFLSFLRGGYDSLENQIEALRLLGLDLRSLTLTGRQEMVFMAFGHEYPISYTRN